MLEDHSQKEGCYAGLFAKYQLEWHSFTRETDRLQLLKEGEQSDPTIVAEAEALARSAEERYRRARNRLSEHVIKHSARRGLVVA